MLSNIDKYNIILSRDKNYNGKFYTAVKTTKIFCLPSCRAKKPKYEDVIFYDQREDALSNDFRACKVCTP